MSSSKTATRTFSIKKELIQALEKEAQNRNISTRSLINQTLDRCVRQTWPSEKTGVIVIGRYVIRDLFSEMSEEGVKKVAASSAREHKIRALLYGTTQKLESVLEMMDKITGPYFEWFKFIHTFNGRDHKILLTHDMGRMWSVWLETYFITFFMVMLDIPVKSSLTDSTVALEFRA